MKKLLWLLLFSTTLHAASADKFIINPDAGGDVVIQLKNSAGANVEVSRFSPPLGDIARSVGTVGAVANSQGALAAADFTSPTNAHWWSLNTDGSDATTGSAITLTQNGTPLFTTSGFFGREAVVRFNGAQSLSSANAVFTVGNSAFSYGGWFYMDNWSGLTQALIGNQDVSTGWYLRVGGTVDLFSGGSVVSASQNFTAGSWHHIAATYTPSGTLHTLYIDGQKAGTLTATNASPGTPIFRVGAKGATPILPLTGGAQDTFFALETLTDSQVNAIYSHRFTNTQQIAAGHILGPPSFPLTTLTNKVAYYNLTDLTDGSGNGKTLVNNGTAVFTGQNIFGLSDTLTLNGTTQYLSSTDAFFNPGNGHSFGVGGWAAIDSWSTFQLLWSNWAADGSDRGYMIYTDSTGIQFLATNTPGGSDVTFAVPNSFVNGSWHHLFMYFDYPGQVLKAYIDGALVGSRTLANQRALTVSSFKIGTYTTSPAVFAKGRFDENIFLKDVQLTDADIRKLYSAKITHSKNIAAQNQGWFSSWLREDSKLALPLENGWMVDMNANNLYVDFSDLNPGDYVTIKAK